MIVSVFVLFNSCCINLSYDWNSLLKQSFPYFLKHIKNRYDFSVIKKSFFLLSQNKSDLLQTKKTFF